MKCHFIISYQSYSVSSWFIICNANLGHLVEIVFIESTANVLFYILSVLHILQATTLSLQLKSWELYSTFLMLEYVGKILGFICSLVSIFDFAKFSGLSFGVMLEKIELLAFWDSLALFLFPTFIQTFYFISVFLHSVQFWLHSQLFSSVCVFDW